MSVASARDISEGDPGSAGDTGGPSAARPEEPGGGPVDPDLAAVAASLGGGRPDVLAVRTIRVPCAKSHVVAVLHDMGGLAAYEQKCRVVDARPSGPVTGRYSVTGRIARVLPWHREFSYLLHDDGFHSGDAAEFGDGWRISGGFVVHELTADTCEVVHYERYDLPGWARSARHVLGPYMRRSQHREMRIIHDLALLRAAEERARRAVVSKEVPATG